MNAALRLALRNPNPIVKGLLTRLVEGLGEDIALTEKTVKGHMVWVIGKGTKAFPLTQLDKATIEECIQALS